MRKEFTALAILLAALPVACAPPQPDYNRPEGTEAPYTRVQNLPYYVRRYCDGRNLVYVGHNADSLQVIPAAPECVQ